MPETFLEYFDRELGTKLDVDGRQDVRGKTFRRAFAHLSSHRQAPYRIVETGCVRTADNWIDGQSTLVFDRFCQMENGTLITMDIDAAACEFARRSCSDRTEVICGDSVSSLHRLVQSRQLDKVDLLYLDSFDLDKSNPHPSALHHLMELCAISPVLRPGTVLIVDDTYMSNRQILGKGAYVAQYLRSTGTGFVVQGFHLLSIIGEASPP